jgi:hypothetical protein
MSQVDSQLALCGATQEWHQYNLIHMLIMCKASLYKYIGTGSKFVLCASIKLYIKVYHYMK